MAGDMFTFCLLQCDFGRCRLPTYGGHGVTVKFTASGGGCVCLVPIKFSDVVSVAADSFLSSLHCQNGISIYSKALLA